VFTVWFYERLKVSIQDEGDRKHVLNFVEFQNIVTFFGILDALGGMPTALWNDSGDSVYNGKDVGSTDKQKFDVHVVICQLRVEKDS